RKQALSILQAKLEQIEEERRQAEIDSATGGKVDRGWGTQIRSYVFYDNRGKYIGTGSHRLHTRALLSRARVCGGSCEGITEAGARRRRAGREKSAPRA